MKKHNYVSLFILFSSTIIIQSCSDKGVKTDEKLIHSQNAMYLEAYNSKNAAGVAALHTDDVFVMPPNFPIVKGRGAVQSALAEEIQAGGQNMVFTTIAMNVEGNYAYEIGQYTMTIDPDEKSAINDTGKYIVVWEKQNNGEWLMKADIWNTNLPK